MDFKVINRLTENKLDPLLQKALFTIDVNQKVFFLNRYACEKIGVWIGDYIELLNLGKHYYIAKSTPPHGYRIIKGQISKVSNEYITVRFMSAPAIRILKEHYKIETSRKNFYLLATQNEYKGNLVYELLPLKK